MKYKRSFGKHAATKPITKAIPGGGTLFCGGGNGRFVGKTFYYPCVWKRRSSVFLERCTFLPLPGGAL
jgi:hypothetical protein